MKSILLTTTAIVAFAGAAAADGHTSASFSGDATLGYNDTTGGDNDGFYWESDLNVALSAALDNGVTAGAEFEFDIVDETNGQATVSDLFVLSLTTENAGLFFGDTAYAAETQWDSAGDMEADGFSEQDGENVLRGDFTFAGVDTSISYNVGGDPAADTPIEVNQLSLGASGDLGMFSFSFAYQEEADYIADGSDPLNANEIIGVSAGVSFAGADIEVAYAEDLTAEESSIGFQVAYPFGPVTATAYYVVEDDATDEDNYGVTVAYSDGPIAVTLDYDYDQGVQKVGLDGSYDVGNGLTILAGVYSQSDSSTEAADGTDAYIAGSYDLGGGAELLVAYADAETSGAIDDDEVGDPEYQVGSTVEVSFSF